jgi:glutaredoxin
MGGSCLSSKAQVIVYSRPGCHLCDEAKAVIAAAGCDDQFMLTEINIETDPELMAKYQYDVPVISINGVETFIHRVDPTEFHLKILRISTDYTDYTD